MAYVVKHCFCFGLLPIFFTENFLFLFYRKCVEQMCSWGSSCIDFNGLLAGFLSMIHLIKSMIKLRNGHCCERHEIISVQLLRPYCTIDEATTACIASPFALSVVIQSMNRISLHLVSPVMNREPMANPILSPKFRAFMG